MQQSGICSDQGLHKHIQPVSEQSVWDTNVELCVLWAIAEISTVIVYFIDANSVNWNLRQNYIHSQLEAPLQCDVPSLKDKGCVCYTKCSIIIWEMNTSTPSIFNNLTTVHKPHTS